MQKIRLRSAERSDLQQLAQLADQLGYGDSIDRINARFLHLENSQDHVLIVAELEVEKTLVGLAYLKRYDSFFVDSCLEVGGLVIDEKYRGLGVGRMLMEKANEIARDWGMKTIRLTSNIKRTEAHAFYTALGFENPKSSHLFIKSVDVPHQKES